MAELQLIETGPLRYLLSTPGEAGDGARPVLVFLHGYDEGAPMDIHRALTLHGPLRSGNPPVPTEEFIVVAPQLGVRGDLWPRSAEAVRRITEQVQAEHGGDPRRTYLTGFSFGGNGVFDVALAEPGAWAALWAVDPTRVPQRDPGLPVWLSSGEVSRWRKAGFIRTLRLAESDPARPRRPRVRGPGPGPRRHRHLRVPQRGDLPLAARPPADGVKPGGRFHTEEQRKQRREPVTAWGWCTRRSRRLLRSGRR